MTPSELLDMALRGSETEWAKLHNICKDRNCAEVLARMLEKNATQAVDAADAWAQVLQEMHPGLTVNLPPAASV